MSDRMIRPSAACLLLVLAAFGISWRPAAAAPREVTAWTSGLWFDGTGFKRIDVYSVGDRLRLERPARIDRTVDLRGRHITGAFGEAHNHNLPGADTNAMIRTYLQGIFHVMIQANMPEGRDSVAARVNTPTSVDVVFANGVFTAPGGHPSALVARNIKSGGMPPTAADGSFIHPVTSINDIDRAWTTRILTQHPDFIKAILAYSEDRVAGVPVPTTSDRYGLDPSILPHLVERAHQDSLRVSVHVESAYDFEVAVSAGADIIAHMSGFLARRGPHRGEG